MNWTRNHKILSEYDIGRHIRHSCFTGISRKLASSGAVGGGGRFLVLSIPEERVGAVAEVAVGA